MKHQFWVTIPHLVGFEMYKYYKCISMLIYIYVMGFTGDSVLKNLPGNAETTGNLSSIPGSGRSPRGGNGKPLQYSWLLWSEKLGRLQSMGSQTVGRDWELTPPKDVLFYYRRLICKSRKSRNTCKFGLGVENEAGQRLIEFCQENAVVTANTLIQQHKRRLYTWTSPDGQHRNQIDYILCSQRWRSSIQSTKTRPGADCGTDHELLIAKFGLKLKKVGKTTRPFRYDLNQIPYDYTVEVRNRFKGLDLIECLMNYGRRFMTLYRRQWSSPSPRKRNAKR